MRVPYGPPDPYAGFRDEPVPVQSTVCLPPAAPRTQGEALQTTFDSSVQFFILVILVALAFHVFLPRLVAIAEQAPAFLKRHLAVLIMLERRTAR